MLIRDKSGGPLLQAEFEESLGGPHVAAVVQVEVGPAPRQAGHGGQVKDHVRAFEAGFQGGGAQVEGVQGEAGARRLNAAGFGIFHHF